MLQQLGNQVNRILAILVFRHQGAKASPRYFWEFKLHVGWLFFVLFDEVFWCRPNNVMNSYYLVIFVVTWKERYKCQHLVNNAPNSPHVHFVRVVSVCHKALRCAIPPCRDVFGARLCRVYTSARAEVCQFHQIFFDKDILTKQIYWNRNYGLTSLWKIPFLCIWSIDFNSWYI